MKDVNAEFKKKIKNNPQHRELIWEELSNYFIPVKSKDGKKLTGYMERETMQVLLILDNYLDVLGVKDFDEEEYIDLVQIPIRIYGYYLITTEELYKVYIKYANNMTFAQMMNSALKYNNEFVEKMTNIIEQKYWSI